MVNNLSLPGNMLWGLTKIGEVDVAEVIVEALREGVCPDVEERRRRVFREMGLFSFSLMFLVR